MPSVRADPRYQAKVIARIYENKKTNSKLMKGQKVRDYEIAELISMSHVTFHHRMCDGRWDAAGINETF